MHAHVSECVSVNMRQSECVFGMCMRDRVSQPPCVWGGRGDDSCPSPRRWQPAEQQQSLLGVNLSVCCCCRCCSHRRRWLIELDVLSPGDCLCSNVLRSLHLCSSSCCLGSSLFPIPTRFPFVPSASSTPPLDAQLLGRGTYPLPGSRCCGGEVGSEAGGPGVSVPLSVSL